MRRVALTTSGILLSIIVAGCLGDFEEATYNKTVRDHFEYTTAARNATVHRDWDYADLKQIVTREDVSFLSDGEISTPPNDRLITFASGSKFLLYEDDPDGFQVITESPSPMSVRELTEWILSKFELTIDPESVDAAQHVYRLIGNFSKPEHRNRLVDSFESGKMTLSEIVAFGFGEEATFFDGVVLRPDGQYELIMVR